MTEQAPLSYIADYYASVHHKCARFPQIAAFWLGGLGHVTGKRVINLGCGPMFYDNLQHFGERPARYVGLDLNANSFRFLREGDHPALVAARTAAKTHDLDMEFIAGDVFVEAHKLTETFDTVLGVGFFGTFDPDPLKTLIDTTKTMLNPGGQIIKLTWHGAHRTEAENALKRQYGYDNEMEPAPDHLVRQFEARGLMTRVNTVYSCPADTIGWDAIQLAVFQKP